MGDWTIKEDHKQTMSAFMADFWAMVKESYEMPDGSDKAMEDHYWSTLVKWADALGKKYDCDPVISGMIVGYLDGQSVKSNGQRIKVELIDAINT